MRNARQAGAAVRRQRWEKHGFTGHCGKQNTGARTSIIHQEPGPAFASAQGTKHCGAEGSAAALESKRPRIGVGGGSAQTAHSAPTRT